MKDLKYYLEKATKEDFALAAINFSNLEALQAIASATEKLNSPAIISVSESSVEYMGSFLPFLAKAAKEINPALFLHLDHGKSFEICKKAVDMGFDSVMIDASSLPLEDNIALTKKVCDYAHPKGVLVEGELGQIKGVEDHISAANDIYTNPKDAKKFVEESGVDLLAVSIGTSHGVYKNGGSNLRFDILAEIEKEIPSTPLVLHGASSVEAWQIEAFKNVGGALNKAGGITTENLINAVTNHHIAKVNTDTDIRLATTTAVRKHLIEKPASFDPRSYLGEGREKVEEIVMYKLEKILNSKNKREC